MFKSEPHGTHWGQQYMDTLRTTGDSLELQSKMEHFWVRTTGDKLGKEPQRTHSDWNHVELTGVRTTWDTLLVRT